MTVTIIKTTTSAENSYVFHQNWLIESNIDIAVLSTNPSSAVPNREHVQIKHVSHGHIDMIGRYALEALKTMIKHLLFLMTVVVYM